jgi:hypothetical protein
MMERPRPQSKVSLEDLLRLKRAERPPQEFWPEFESELRRKQLAAIVDKRPWWRRVSASNLVRLSLPAGAAAVLAFTVFSYRASFVSAPEVLSPELATVRDARADEPSVTAPAVTVHARAAESDALLAGVSTGAQPVVEHKEATMASAILDELPLLQESDVRIAQAEKETSLAQVILGIESGQGDARPQFDLAHGVTLIPTVTSQLGLGNAAEAAESSPADTLSRLASAMDGRRARLLVSVDAHPRDALADNPRVARTRDRIASRLDERALSDSISRLGLNADSVSIKF